MITPMTEERAIQYKERRIRNFLWSLMEIGFLQNGSLHPSLESAKEARKREGGYIYSQGTPFGIGYIRCNERVTEEQNIKKSKIIDLLNEKGEEFEEWVEKLIDGE